MMRRQVIYSSGDMADPQSQRQADRLREDLQNDVEMAAEFAPDPFSEEPHTIPHYGRRKSFEKPEARSQRQAQRR